MGDYEDGVRNGQKGGFLDDFAQGLANTGSEYDKGYAYGVDHRRDSSGERFHTWSGDGKNDPKPSSSSSGFSNLFGSGGSSSSSSSDEDEVSPSSGSSSSSGGGGGGGGYSGGGSRSSSVLGGLVMLVGALIVGGAIYLGISRKSLGKPNTPQETKLADKYNGKNLEENVKLLLEDIQIGNVNRDGVDDYKIIPPRKVRRIGEPGSDSEYEMAIIGHNYPLRMLHTSDNGRNWDFNSLPIDPFFKKLCFDEAFQMGVKHDKWAERVTRNLEGYAMVVDKEIKDFEDNRNLLKNAISAEENIRRLFKYVQENYQLGDLNHYQMMLPPRMILKEHREIALFDDNAFYVFHSFDNGRTWAPLPPTEPFLIKLRDDYEERKMKRQR